MRMSIPQCQTEVENHSTEPRKKSVNKTVLGPDGSMNEIKTDSTGREWIDIGGTKKWVRWCPSCGKAVLCPSWAQASKLTRRGIKCLECGYASRRDPPKRGKRAVTREELTRKCPKCGVDIVYTKKGNRNAAEKNRRLCKMCYAKSTRKYETPDELIRVCPRCGKPIHYTKGKDLSVRRTRWLRDTRENRMCKRCSTSEENNPMFGTHRVGSLNPNFGNRWTDEQKENASLISKAAFIRRKLGGKLHRHSDGHVGNWFNESACRYMDDWSRKNGCDLKHATNVGEFYYRGYFADGYDADKNIWFEYDEKHHYYKNGNLKQKDIDRMNTIIHHLHCKFFRYNEKANLLYECN